MALFSLSKLGDLGIMVSVAIASMESIYHKFHTIFLLLNTM